MKLPCQPSERLAAAWWWCKHLPRLALLSGSVSWSALLEDGAKLVRLLNALAAKMAKSGEMATKMWWKLLMYLEAVERLSPLMLLL